MQGVYILPVCSSPMHSNNHFASGDLKLTGLVTVVKSASKTVCIHKTTSIEMIVWVIFRCVMSIIEKMKLCQALKIAAV